jgi:cardiolipin synthase
MTLPNVITLFRILLIPIYLLIFYSGTENRILFSGLVFILAGISDVADGFIARRYNLESKLGALMDPFADKLMSFAVLFTFTSVGLIPVWVLIPMLIKEIVMILGGGLLYLKHKGSVIPSNNFGKVATFSLYASILSIITKVSFNVSLLLLTLTLALNILAFINYMKIFRRLVDDKKGEIDK